MLDWPVVRKKSQYKFIGVFKATQWRGTAISALDCPTSSALLTGRTEHSNKWRRDPVGPSVLVHLVDRLCGIVVRVSGYRYRGTGFDPRRYQIF